MEAAGRADAGPEGGRTRCFRRSLTCEAMLGLVGLMIVSPSRRLRVERSMAQRARNLANSTQAGFTICSAKIFE